MARSAALGGFLRMLVDGAMPEPEPEPEPDNSDQLMQIVQRLDDLIALTTRETKRPVVLPGP